MAGTVTDQANLLASKILSDVKQLDAGEGIRGSEIGLRLRIENPGIDFATFGVANLKQFIIKHVPALKIVKWSGADPVYALSRDDAPRDVPNPSFVRGDRTARGAGGDLWRIWASPRSIYAIAIDRKTLEPRQVLKGGAEGSEIEIRPVRTEVFREFAREFLRTEGEKIPGEVQSRLSLTSQESDSKWWERWTAVLRGQSVSLYERWLDLRRAGLVRELQRSLRSAGVEEPSVPEATNKIIGHRAVQQISGVRGTAPRPREVSEVAAAGSAPELIMIVQAAIARLSDSELRSLKLPVGIVVDVTRELIVR